MHYVPLCAQAEAVGLPLEVVEISSEPTYLDGYRAAITALKERHGIDALATGMLISDRHCHDVSVTSTGCWHQGACKGFCSCALQPQAAQQQKC